MPFVFSVLVFLLVLAAVVDIVVKDDSQVRHLPKIVWILLVILLPLIGAIVWFAVGREYTAPSLPRRRPAGGRQAGVPVVDAGFVPSRPVDPRSTEQQLADLDLEIEEWRLRAELEQRKQGRELDGGAPRE